MVKGIKGSIESYEKSRRNSADIHENVYVKWVHFMKFSILFGGRLWTYFAQFWSLLVQKRQSWRRGSAVFGIWTPSTCLWRLKPVNISFQKRKISNEVWRTGCSKMKYACRVPLMISVEKRTKRNIQGEIDELYCNPRSYIAHLHTRRVLRRKNIKLKKIKRTFPAKWASLPHGRLRWCYYRVKEKEFPNYHARTFFITPWVPSLKSHLLTWCSNW